MSVLTRLKNKLFITGAFLLGASVGAVSSEENETGASAQTVTVSQTDTKKEILIKSFMEIAEKFEGYTLHPYLDTKGNLTIGYGKNIQPLSAFNQVKWQGELNGNALRLKLMQIRKKLMDNKANWKTVRQKNGTEVRIFNVTAKGQKSAFSGIRITKVEAKRLLKTHIEQCLPTLEKNCKSQSMDLYALPFKAQEVLLDIHYNTGNASAKAWPSLYSALKASDWEKAAKESSRKDVQTVRNLWAARQMRYAGLISELEKNGISYEKMPAPAQDVVHYMSAVLKNKFTAKKWPKLFEALKKRDYKTASKECRILNLNEAKNIWMKERMLEATHAELAKAQYLTITRSR